MRRGLSMTSRAFRDLIRRRGYPCSMLVATDASRDASFSEATGRARGHKALVTSAGLTAVSYATLCVRQVSDSLEHAQAGVDGIQVRGKAALYLYKERIDQTDPYTDTGVELRPKPTDEFIVLSGTNREKRYAVASKDYESIEVYEDAVGDPIFYVVWVEVVDKAVIAAVETSWTPSGAL